MGPLMVDVDGTSLTAEDKEILAHPLVGGLILFSRNFHSIAQLAELNQQIRAAAKGPILIAVDHEGGRVQRFRKGFSAIPAMGSLWQASHENLEKAQHFANMSGYLMAAEVMASGIDISFAPVLDVNGVSDVIGDRGFHQSPEIVSLLSSSFIAGMHQAGMKATGKHFPGHGSVKEDSHVAMPVDNRDKADIFQHDLLPFKQLMEKQLLSALMPAHVVFPSVDTHAVGFSRTWLQTILRQQLNFNGVIFSDDLSMAGASIAGGFIERAEAAQQAGCDMLLMCNNRAAAITVIDSANLDINSVSSSRIASMLKTSQVSFEQLTEQSEWQQAKSVVEHIHTLI